MVHIVGSLGVLHWFIRDEAVSLLLKTWGKERRDCSIAVVFCAEAESWLEGVKVYWDMSSGLIAWHICMIEDLQ